MTRVTNINCARYSRADQHDAPSGIAAGLVLSLILFWLPFYALFEVVRWWLA